MMPKRQLFDRFPCDREPSGGVLSRNPRIGPPIAGPYVEAQQGSSSRRVALMVSVVEIIASFCWRGYTRAGQHVALCLSINGHSFIG